MTKNTPCPCNSGKLFSECCGPVIKGVKRAYTAESLMRSRYTAYVTRDVDYLLKTWHPTSRPTAIDRLTIPEWRRLDIISTELGGVGDERGIVEFRATYMGLQNIHILHEVSRFVREKGWWLYVDGEIKNDPSPVGMLNKIGRNASCPCGSGRKFKKCCMG